MDKNKVLFLGDSIGASVVHMQNPADKKTHLGTSSIIGYITHHLRERIELIDETCIGRNCCEDEKSERDPVDPADFNGKKALLRNLSHDKLSAVIIQLGANDFRNPNNKTPDQVISSIFTLINMIRSNNNDTKIILMAPVLLNDNNMTPFIRSLFIAHIDKFTIFAGKLQALAQRMDCFFIDTRLCGLAASGDGLHLSAEQNRFIGAHFVNILRTI